MAACNTSGPRIRPVTGRGLDPRSKAIPALILSLFLSLSCSRNEPFRKDTFVMGTKAEITIYGVGAGTASEVAGRALHELHRIESVMSTWNDSSEISRLNQSADGKARRVSAELFGIIERGAEYSRITGGAFDVTSRPLVVMWGFQGRGASSLPTGEMIEETLRSVGYLKMALDRSDTTVALETGMQIDLAGIAKGYGVDRCVEILREGGVKSALVNLGGNMYALGAPEGRDGWTVGIRDPEGGTGIVGRILLRDEAVSTSGNYENFVEIERKRYGHIIDPRTGLTVGHLLSVTVVAPDATAADALSTGLFVLGYDEGRRLVETLPGVRAVFALEDGRIEFVGDFGDNLLLD